MGEGLILDPFDSDPRMAEVLRRLGAVEQRPQVTPPLYYQATPYRSSVAPDANWYTGHTNAVLGDVGGSPWAIPLPRVAKPAAYCRVAWTTPGATTGELQLTAQGGANVTSVVVLPAGSSGVQTFLWLHGVALWTAAINFDLYARRASGAGTVLVQAPTFALVDSTGATLTGV